MERVYKKYFIMTAVFTAIVSVVFVVMCFNLENASIVAVSSAIISIIGGSLASVVVAWLIEVSNQKSEKQRNKQIMDCVLVELDLYAKIEFERILRIYAKGSDLDLYKSYSVDEIIELVEKFDCENSVFDIFCESFDSVMNKIDTASILLFDKTSVGINLFQQLERIKGYIKIVKTIKENSIKEIEKDAQLVSFIVLQIIEIVGEINRIRGQEEYYRLSDDDKKYITSFREAKKQNKEEHNAAN